MVWDEDVPPASILTSQPIFDRVNYRAGGIIDSHFSSERNGTWGGDRLVRYRYGTRCGESIRGAATDGAGTVRCDGDSMKWQATRTVVRPANVIVMAPSESSAVRSFPSWLRRV